MFRVWAAAGPKLEGMYVPVGSSQAQDAPEDGDGGPQAGSGGLNPGPEVQGTLSRGTLIPGTLIRLTAAAWPGAPG